LFWAHASTTAGGSRSTRTVEMGAISGKKLKKKSAFLCKSHTCYCQKKIVLTTERTVNLIHVNVKGLEVKLS